MTDTTFWQIVKNRICSIWPITRNLNVIHKQKHKSAYRQKYYLLLFKENTGLTFLVIMVRKALMINSEPVSISQAYVNGLMFW